MKLNSYQESGDIKMSKEKLLICGPWIGEFAYELIAWAPKLRYYINNHYKGYKVLVVSYPGRSILYRDFADEFIGYSNDIVDNMIPCNSGGVGHGNQHTLEYSPTEEFVQDIIDKNRDKYEEIFLLRPKDLRCVSKGQVAPDLDDVEFAYIKPDIQTDGEVNKILNQFESSNTVCIMANTQHEVHKYRENWKVESWVYFIDKLISELNLNVVMMGIKSSDKLQGSYTFEDTELYTKYPNRIKSYVVDTKLPNSLDIQISLMSNTKCNIWGASGAQQLAYFVDKPMFAQLATGFFERATKKEYNDITHNFKYIKFFCKYPKGIEFYNSPAEELYLEFKEFYNKLDN